MSSYNFVKICIFMHCMQKICILNTMHFCLILTMGSGIISARSANNDIIRRFYRPKSCETSVLCDRNVIL